MRSLERGKRHESLDSSIARVAYAYGFSAAPVVIAKKALVGVPDDVDPKTAAAIALVNGAESGKGPSQTWGSARRSNGTTLSFAIFSTKHAIAHAIVVKTALSISELAGYKDLAVHVSSIGDLESRKRFTRELGNFFKKHHDLTPADLKQLAVHDPDAAYRVMLHRKDPSLERAPRSIDFLSENSRKTMLATLSLFESVGIAYSLNPRLVAHPGVESELLFAIEGTDREGARVRVATGGRYDEHAKRVRGPDAEPAVAMNVHVPKRIDVEAEEEEPLCFVVHVGDAAKLKAFALLEALWRSHIAVGQALMAENLREQVLRGVGAKTTYIAIIGQREALDSTVIVRNVATQMQITMPLEKLNAYVMRGLR